MIHQPFRVQKGRGVPMRRSDIDTDQITPARFCKRITKSGYADALFADLRKEPDFSLNHPERKGSKVLISGPNFGTGSSREHAVWSLRDWGFTAVIAESFGDIFYRNSFKNGLLPVALEANAVESIMQASEQDASTQITIDLEQKKISVSSQEWQFDVSDHGRRMLLDGQDEISSTLEWESEISFYEKNRPDSMPRFQRTPLNTDREETQ